MDQEPTDAANFPETPAPLSFFHGRAAAKWSLINLPDWVQTITVRNTPGAELYIALPGGGATIGEVRTGQEHYLRVMSGEQLPLSVIGQGASKRKAAVRTLAVSSNASPEVVGHEFFMIACS